MTHWSKTAEQKHNIFRISKFFLAFLNLAFLEKNRVFGNLREEEKFRIEL